MRTLILTLGLRALKQMLLLIRLLRLFGHGECVGLVGVKDGFRDTNCNRLPPTAVPSLNAKMANRLVN